MSFLEDVAGELENEIDDFGDLGDVNLAAAAHVFKEAASSALGDKALKLLLGKLRPKLEPQLASYGLE